MLATRKSQPTHLDTQLYMHARREYVCWSVPLVCVCVIFGRMSRREAQTLSLSLSVAKSSSVGWNRWMDGCVLYIRISSLIF
jgi:hypothetical protein